MKIVIFGLAITSSWGNGHATTYRSLCKALARRGHIVHFVEKNVECYRNNRDLPRPDFCTVQFYDEWKESARSLLRLSRDADVIVIGSYFPDAIATTAALFDSGIEPVLFYDIDTPITVAQLRAHGSATYLDGAHIPHYAAYLSFSGGPVLRELEERFGARYALPFYCSVDPEIYRPTQIRSEYRCELSYLGNFAADRQPKLARLLNEPARAMPQSRFIVAGVQYPKTLDWVPNVDRILHLSPPEHPAFYSSARFTLNLTRQSMIAAGFSPSVRLFQASACGAAIISDAWKGLDHFLTPGREVLLPRDADDVVEILRNFPEDERRRIGLNARERILAQHTASQRAIQFEEILQLCAGVPDTTSEGVHHPATAPVTILSRRMQGRPFTVPFN